MTNYIPTCLNERGQAHVSEFLAKHGLERWSVSGCCDVIEDQICFQELAHGQEDVAYIEMVRRGQIGNDAPIEIEILADEHVRFEEAVD